MHKTDAFLSACDAFILNNLPGEAQFRLEACANLYFKVKVENKGADGEKPGKIMEKLGNWETESPRGEFPCGSSCSHFNFKSISSWWWLAPGYVSRVLRWPLAAGLSSLATSSPRLTHFGSRFSCSSRLVPLFNFAGVFFAARQRRSL